MEQRAAPRRRHADRFTFGRWDFMLAYVLMVLAMAVVAVFEVVLPAAAWWGSRALDVRLEAGWAAEGDLPPVKLGPGGTRVTVTDGIAHVTDAPAWLLSIELARGVALLVLMGVVLFLLARIMRTVKHGSPFLLENVRRLKLMGRILVMSPILMLSVDGTFNASIYRHVTGGDSVLGLWGADALPIALFAFGVMLECIAEVFRRGVALEGDVEGLV